MNNLSKLLKIKEKLCLAEVNERKKNQLFVHTR